MSIYNDTTGLTKNPFIILDAVDYMGEDAYEEYEATAKDYNVAKVTGPNKTIMDTDYLGANEMLGLHQVFVNWYSDFVTPLSFEYWWRDSDGNEDSYPITSAARNATSMGVGHNFGVALFNENLEYRIVIKSNNNVGKNNYVYVDFVKLMARNHYHPTINTMQYYGTTPTVPVEYAGYKTITTGATGSYEFTVTLPTTVLSHIPVVSPFVISAATYVACVNSQTANEFTGLIARRDGGGFSGTLYVFYKVTAFESFISLE